MARCYLQTDRGACETFSVFIHWCCRLAWSIRRLPARTQLLPGSAVGQGCSQ
jgi:hypothetical protein